MLGLRTIDGGECYLAFGQIALDGTNPTPVVTGLSKIFPGCHGASLSSSVAPGAGTSALATTPTANAGTLNIHGFMPTGAALTALIVSTATEVVNWWAIGQK